MRKIYAGTGIATVPRGAPVSWPMPWASNLYGPPDHLNRDSEGIALDRMQATFGGNGSDLDELTNLEIAK
jgi:hypothetical protein